MPTSNRLNLVAAFLVLLAGTGADHRLTKWSAKACEDRAGMGKPRARTAIGELIGAGLAERTPTSRPAFPQYRLAEPNDAREPIFLPMQLVTGLADETPMLRRVRETGDALLLRLLVELYGLVQTDATHGVPLAHLRSCDPSEAACRKISEIGSNAIWALHLGGTRFVQGAWCALHATGKKASKVDRKPFWERLDTLEAIGGFWFEPWVFNGPADDAEPLVPVRIPGRQRDVPGNVMILSALTTAAAHALVGERTYLISQHPGCTFVVLPAHHRPPAIRGVARLRVEPDTPGRRLAYAKRMDGIARHTAAYEQLVRDAQAARHDRPIEVG